MTRFFLKQVIRTVLQYLCPIVGACNNDNDNDNDDNDFD